MKHNSVKRNLVAARDIAVIGLVMFLFAALAVAAAGCTAETAPQPDTPGNPFTVVWGQEKEHVVRFSGNSAAHVAGKTSEFELKLINNNSSEPWNGRYFVQLLDTDAIVADIASDMFSVPAGLQSAIVITAGFPGRLGGPYGLSLLIPDREGQIIQTIWIGEITAAKAGPWPSLGTHPWLWPEISVLTEEEARQTAEEFVRNSPTFAFDGIEDTLQLIERPYRDTGNSWRLVFHFESRHAGYGDRTGQMLAQVITPHEAVITFEQGTISSAVLDGEWDMLSQAHSR